MELNAESVLDALNDFERKPTEIPPILEDYLLRIAQNGEIIFPWCKLKPLLKRKLEIVLDEFYETCPVEISVPVPNFETFNYDNLKKTILSAVDGFSSAPFTIQRLCELVTNPKKHYNRTDKYMRGIEKNVLVVSTIEPRIGIQGDGNNANINPVVNGLISDAARDDNDCFKGHESTDNVSSSNLNTSSNHVLLENFANVFPSAACIPSASNILIEREIDNNFMANAECVETQEVEFEPQAPADQPENMESKEEDMDTASEEESFQTNDSSDASNDTKVPTENTSVLPEEESAKPEQTDDSIKTETDESCENGVSDRKNVKIEADCSESSSDPVIPEKKPAGLDQCQQDDTVSQSDDSSEVVKISQSNETFEEKQPPNDETDCTENSTEVTQSITTSDSADQCMELESSSSKESSG